MKVGDRVRVIKGLKKYVNDGFDGKIGIIINYQVFDESDLNWLVSLPEINLWFSADQLEIIE